jgi:hypothetical protein
MTEEFADMRHRRDAGTTAYRLKLTRHATCACGQPASVLHGTVMCCRVCSEIRRQKNHMRMLLETQQR